MPSWAKYRAMALPLDVKPLRTEQAALKKSSAELTAQLEAVQSNLDELKQVRWCVRQVLPDALPTIIGEAGQLDDLQQHIDFPCHAGCDIAADKPVDLAFQPRLIVNDTVHGKQLVMETLHGVEREEIVRKQFVNELLYEDDVPALQEYLGYCLLPVTKAQKMLRSGFPAGRRGRPTWSTSWCW